MSTVRPLSDVFTARAIGMAWDNYQQTIGEAPFLGRTKFGTRKQAGLDLKFIKGQNGLPVSLKASHFDAQAELRDGIGFTEIQNEMPFFRESVMVTEKEEQDYASFVESTSVQYANQILQNIMKKPLDLVRGAKVVPERMIWQLLCPTDGIPKINVKVGSSSYTINYLADSTDDTAYKNKHYSALSGTSAWDQKTTATPLQDLIDIKRDFAKKTGYTLARFSMNTETFQLLMDANDTRLQVLGSVTSGAGVRVKQSQVIDYLAEYGIEIELYDKMYYDEATSQGKYFIPTGYVACQSAGVFLGDFVFGTTPEERSGSLLTGSLSIVETGISIYTYATNHPVNTHSVVSMLGLPTFEGMDSVYTLKVK